MNCLRKTLHLKMSKASAILKLVEEDGQFAKRRDDSVDLNKDWSKSQESERAAKRNGATNRWATKRASHSPEGRRRHRKIGRLLAKSTNKRTSAFSDR